MWESPHTQVIPGSYLLQSTVRKQDSKLTVKPCSGPITWTMPTSLIRVFLWNYTMHAPCLRSFIPKYVNPNSFTLSSKAAHCARESGSAIKLSTDVKFFREAVLESKFSRATSKGKYQRTERCGRRWPGYNQDDELNALHFVYKISAHSSSYSKRQRTVPRMLVGS